MSYVPNGAKLIFQNGDVTRQQNEPFEKKIFKTSRRSRNSRSRAGRKQNGASDPLSYPIIVHCHLCWDWVWQRPQQFISRLSERHKILFIETIGPDPQLAAPYARFYTPEKFPNVTVLRFQFPAWCWGEGAYIDRERRRLLKNFLQGPGARQFEKPVQWFYDPMTVPSFAGQMDEILTVYDCMDELSKFRCAPPEIREREKALLDIADVVFTGGYKLFEARRLQNDNCHFYGCGVDGEHFGKALDRNTRVPADLAALKGPVLGYFGVVDERMDYDLVAKLADANPAWSIAIVGPVLKVEDHALPRRPNLHWLGQRAYAELPAYCRGFDVCLMPFALNEATEYINPTKALEYMAAGRQIVSTAISDVIKNFGTVVKVARNHDEFIAACRSACERPDREAIQGGLQMASKNSWDYIVSRLENHVKEALVKKQPIIA